MVSSNGTVRRSSVKSDTSASVRSRASRKSSKRKSAGSVLIVSPPSRTASAGNTITAQRYARMFRALGHSSRIAPAFDGQDAACLVALHARKSAKSVLAYRAAYPRRRIILVLTGTDVYRDIRRSRAALRAMEAADVLVTLQPQAIAEVPPHLRKKVRAIIQSSPRRAHKGRADSTLRICVLGHLRSEKDPMRAAYALRKVDPQLDVEVTHGGGILAPSYERATRDEMERNPRYRYVGELRRSKALTLLARSDLLIQSSRLEGGANTVCEALACGTPVLASRIPGNTGILGRRYPGLYDAGDSEALAQLIELAATSRTFYRQLRTACERLAPLVDPKREARAWRELLE
ncbi:MAG TPA: selenoneine biosynthesis selenosugar synthase SenB [Candidatus Baltobacteraceae bacterium]|nr:selenoneine biosynthesis selenosugar synthase SenB [Candidatus Baltobacteraceae bacterium]